MVAVEWLHEQNKTNIYKLIYLLVFWLWLSQMKCVYLIGGLQNMCKCYKSVVSIEPKYQESKLEELFY